MDKYLEKNVMALASMLQKDYDIFGLVTGRERRGKSTLAGQIAKRVDQTYDVSRCCFTAEQFIEAIEHGKPGEAIVFDEAYGYLNSRQALSKFNRVLIKIMTEMGRKRLFVIIVLPNFFELDKYPALHRSDFLLHVHKRGAFVFFDYDRKKRLYLKGKKFYAYGAVPGNFVGSFNKHLVYNMKEYDDKKKTALTEYNQRQIAKTDKFKDQRDLVMLKYYEDTGTTFKKMSEIFGIPPSTIADCLGNARNLRLTEQNTITTRMEGVQYPTGKEDKG